MKSRRRFEELRETLLVLFPVKLAAINNDACRIRTRDAEPFGRGCNDYVCSVINGAKKKASCSSSIVTTSAV